MTRYSLVTQVENQHPSLRFGGNPIWISEFGGLKLQSSTPEGLIKLLAVHLNINIAILDPKENECGAV